MSGSLRAETPVVEPVACERLGYQSGTRPREDQTDPAVPVRRPANRLVEAADLEQSCPPNACEAEDEVLLEDGTALVGDVESKCIRITAPNDFAVHLERRVGREEVEIRPRRRQPAESLEALGQEDIVCVEDDDEVSTRRTRGRVLRGGLASVLLAQKDDLLEVRAQGAPRCRPSSHRRRRSPRPAARSVRAQTQPPRRSSQTPRRPR